MKTRASLLALTLIAALVPAVHAEELYTVAAGDSLSKISRQFDVPYREIMEANQLPNTQIYIGQVLTIPESRKSADRTISEPIIVATPVERYRSPGLNNSTLSGTAPVDPASDSTVGTFSGEASIQPLDPEPPSAHARPLHTYPAPSQDRFAIPTAPVYTEVSPYNDGKPPASGPVTDSNKTGRIVPISSQKGGTYIVQSGDTIRSISREFGVHFWDLRTANNIQFKKIYPGQILKIPMRQQ